jgi:hypothetical protein
VEFNLAPIEGLGTRGQDIMSSNVPNQLMNIDVTTSSLEDQKNIYFEVKKLLENAIKHDEVCNEDKFNKLIGQLILDSEYRLECEVLFRALKKKNRKQVNKQDVDLSEEKIIQSLNEQDSIYRMDELLVALKNPDYLNLGQEARLAVSAKLVESNTLFKTIKEVEKQMTLTINELKELLKDLNKAGGVEEYSSILNKMELPTFSSLPPQIQEDLSLVLYNKEEITFSTYVQLSKEINALIENYDISIETLEDSDDLSKKFFKVVE